jgi:hypothetical protein
MSHEARSIARLVAAVLLVLLLGLPAMASADPSYQARFASAERVIRAHEPTIVSWEQRSHIAVAIGLAIATLGIAIGVLQTLNGRWTKPATLVIGALITAISAANWTLFDGDATTLSARAREGRRLIASADRFIAFAPSLATDEDREEVLGYIQQSAESLAVLSGGGSKGRPVASAAASAFPSPFTTLYAAGGGCACAMADQRDTDTERYICGQGTATSLAEARAEATDEALAQAGVAPVSYLRNVATEVAACPVSGRKGFTMFVLLRVPTTLTNTSAQQAFISPRWE